MYCVGGGAENKEDNSQEMKKRKWKEWEWAPCPWCPWKQGWSLGDIPRRSPFICEGLQHRTPQTGVSATGWFSHSSRGCLGPRFSFCMDFCLACKSQACSFILRCSFLSRWANKARESSSSCRKPVLLAPTWLSAYLTSLCKALCMNTVTSGERPPM